MTKEAEREYKRRYREANKERILAREKAYREANKERVAIKNKKYREANKDKIKAIQKTYREANRKKESARQRDWERANIKAIGASYCANRLKKQGFTPDQITPELIEVKRQLIKINRTIKQR